MKTLNCCYLVFLILNASYSFSQEPLQSGRLNELNQKISSLQAEQKSLNGNIAANEKLSLKLSQDIGEVQNGISKSAMEIGNLKGQASTLSSEVSDYSERHRDLSRQSSNRLRAMYIAGGGQQIAVSLSSNGKASLGQLSHYMSKLRAHEIYNLNEINRLSSELGKRIDELKGKTQELERLQEQAQKQHEELKKKQAEFENTKATLKKQLSSKARILSELRSEALRLETVLSSLVEPSDSLLNKNKDPSAQNSETFSSTTKETEQSADSAALSEGLADKFDAPVQGLVVTKFGANVSDGLDQMVKSKGIGFVVPENQEVHSVAGGKISFVGALGTYGNVVIIEHGKRMYTLYSQLASMQVSLGKSVNQGDVLGKTGPIAFPRPYNLYFEVRKEGKAIDPKPFLR